MSTHVPAPQSSPSTPPRWWQVWPEWKIALAFVLLMLALASIPAVVVAGFGVVLTQNGVGSHDPAGEANDRHALIVASVIFVSSLVALAMLRRSESDAQRRMKRNRS